MRVWVAGHTGLLGSELAEALRPLGEVLTVPRAQLDLRNGAGVQRWMEAARPEVVVLAAARVGGIAANLAAPVAFLVENLQMQNSVLVASAVCGVRRVVWFGSSAMYPAEAPQPLREASLMSGPIERSLRPYALAKLTGVELSAALRRECGLGVLCVAPPNLYGAGDDFGERATVLPALLRRVAEAKARGDRTLTVWGTGRARREMLPAAELAGAVRFLLELEGARWDALVDGSPGENEWPLLNVGAGRDYAMGEIAEAVGRALGWEMDLVWDASKPEGTLRKLLDSSRMEALGWKARTGLEAGVRAVYEAARRDGRLP